MSSYKNSIDGLKFKRQIIIVQSTNYVNRGHHFNFVKYRQIFFKTCNIYNIIMFDVFLRFRMDFESVLQSANYLLTRTKYRPKLAIVCGSGLGKYPIKSLTKT